MQLKPLQPGKPSDDVAAAMLEAIQFHTRYSICKDPAETTVRDQYTALSLAVRQLLTDRMRETEQRVRDANAKKAYYVSMEYLIGRSLENNLINLGWLDLCRDVLQQSGVCLDNLIESEPDAGLGNGGLGRLAACFIDSMASLDLPGYGYGINYEYGLFRQQIKGGWQHEAPDNWLTYGTPWQLERADEAVLVPLYGHVEQATDIDGNHVPMWVGWKAIIGVPHDMPVVGYGGDTVNRLRLYSARGSQEFDVDVFNDGDYTRAVEEKIRAETVSKVLYPSDAVAEGRELRLIQEYFLVACTVRDIVRRHEREHGSLKELQNFAAIQLNDTHPALTVAELMRLLVDEKSFAWEDAWRIVQNTLCYTNHTLLPEALEKWPLPLMQRVIPRHVEIIFEINQRFLDEVEARWPNDVERLRDMSIIEEAPQGDKQVRMCNLAIVGSHSVNGVSALHSQLVQQKLVPNFYALTPEKFNNKTNGITPRRWLLQANPGLASLITDTMGSDWITHLGRLADLNDFAKDWSFQQQFRQIKRRNKQTLSEIIRHDTGIKVDPDSMFDVQVKRIHQYKRQLLSVLRIVREYLAIKNGVNPETPRTYIFSGKAAPGYWAAKQIIGLINHVAHVVNHDPQAKSWMRVAFLPNYRVSLAERIFPASDLSEQISTAGYEASGTGNMKFMLNGALTMGTLDGANVEMLEEVGADNIFIFGLTTEQVQGEGHVESPQEIYERSPEIQAIFDALRGDMFSRGHSGLFGWTYDMLVDSHDPYFHLADLDSYCTTQDAAGTLYSNNSLWTEKAIRNVAASGKFSSDRTIRQYAEELWGIQPLHASQPCDLPSPELAHT